MASASSNGRSFAQSITVHAGDVTPSRVTCCAVHDTARSTYHLDDLHPPDSAPAGAVPHLVVHRPAPVQSGAGPYRAGLPVRRAEANSLQVSSTASWAPADQAPMSKNPWIIPSNRRRVTGTPACSSRAA
jgi:hypothetical protein